MDLPVNQFKKAIKAGQPQIGIWSSLCSAISAEVLADAGFDWVLLDSEHSPNELPIVQNQLDAMLAEAPDAPRHQALGGAHGRGSRGQRVGDRAAAVHRHRAGGGQRRDLRR